MAEQSTAVAKRNESTIQKIVGNMRFQDAVRAVMPAHTNPDRFLKVLLNSANKTPELAKCSPFSLIYAISQAAQLGLEISGPTGEAYLLPFKGQATFCPGYRGLIKLAIQSGKVRKVESRIVHQNDTFSISYGTDNEIHHTPCLTGEPGKVIGAYAVWTLDDGTKQFEFMTYAEIEKVRQGSPGRNSDAWTLHWDEMARKCPVRRGSKYIPLTPELQAAVAAEEDSERGQIVLDVNFESVAREIEDGHTSRASDMKDKLAAGRTALKAANPPPAAQEPPPAEDAASEPPPEEIVEPGAAGEADDSIFFQMPPSPPAHLAEIVKAIKGKLPISKYGIVAALLRHYSDGQSAKLIDLPESLAADFMLDLQTEIKNLSVKKQ